MDDLTTPLRALPAKWQKKPVVIDAVQWLRKGDAPHAGIVPLDADSEWVCKHCGYVASRHGNCPTLEGWHIVCPGDWIITGIKGEHYPCKPDIFAATYEPAALPAEPAAGGEAAVWLMPVATDPPQNPSLQQYAWGRSKLSTGQMAHAYDCIVSAAQDCGQVCAPPAPRVDEAVKRVADEMREWLHAEQDPGLDVIEQWAAALSPAPGGEGQADG